MSQVGREQNYLERRGGDLNSCWGLLTSAQSAFFFPPKEVKPPQTMSWSRHSEKWISLVMVSQLKRSINFYVCVCAYYLSCYHWTVENPLSWMPEALSSVPGSSLQLGPCFIYSLGLSLPICRNGGGEWVWMIKSLRPWHAVILFLFNWRLNGLKGLASGLPGGWKERAREERFLLRITLPAELLLCLWESTSAFHSLPLVSPLLTTPHFC